MTSSNSSAAGTSCATAYGGPLGPRKTFCRYCQHKYKRLTTKLTEKQGRNIIIAWTIFLVAFYTIAGYLASYKLYHEKVDLMQRHLESLDPYKTEADKTQVDVERLKLNETGDFNEVDVGIYVDRIVEISTKETGWTVDFYIWFRWRGDEVEPGETFHVIDGEIDSRDKIDEHVENGEHYALYRVIANITKVFNVVLYPLDNHLLTIRIEDSDHPWDVLRYVADVKGSDYSSRVSIPGYSLKRAITISKPHAYKTTRGDPRKEEDYQSIYSQIVYGIKVERPDWGLYLKMFQGLFASVAIAIMAFLLGPKSGERISLGIGAFFASVASTYISLSELPGVAFLTLTDLVNGLCMITIFLTLCGSIISERIAKDAIQHSIAVRFDFISLFIFLVGFITVNISMALAAAN